MRTLRVLSCFAVLAFTIGIVSAQNGSKLRDNAALGYWAAFAQMQDSAISGQQVKELTAVLDGSASYEDSKYRDLIEKNTSALETMIRATSVPNCDWGLDYSRGENVPVEYVRKGLVLGRLNVLYTLHKLKAGDKEGASTALVAGFRFSQDIATGGSLFATLIAKSLLVAHFRALTVFSGDGVSSAQITSLHEAVARLGTEPLDWSSATKKEFAVIRMRYPGDSETLSAIDKIAESYVAALNAPTNLPMLQSAIGSAPKSIVGLIPNPQRVLDEKSDLSSKLLKARSIH